MGHMKNLARRDSHLVLSRRVSPAVASAAVSAFLLPAQVGIRLDDCIWLQGYASGQRDLRCTCGRAKLFQSTLLHAPKQAHT